MFSQRTEFLVLIGTALAAVIAGAGLVLHTGWRRLLPPQRWRKLPNVGAYCWALFLIFWIPTPFVAQALLTNVPSLADQRILAGLFASLIVFPLQFVLVWWSSLNFLGATWRIGVPSRHWVWPSVAAGFVTLLAFYPPTEAVNQVVRFVVKNWAGGPPMSEHQLIQELQKQQHNAVYWVMISCESILLAPIREELFFRGAIQPWLGRQVHGGWIGLALAALAAVTLRGDVLGFWNNAGPPMFVLFAGFGLFTLEPVFASIRSKMGALGEYLFPPIASGGRAGQQVYRGVMASSLMFAMFHSASWPDPIPLTVLGIGLGWLAWRTQGVVGPIVCHGLFNALTIFQLRIMALS